MRERIFKIIEVAEENDIVSRVYDIFMIIAIFFSLAPAVVKEMTPPILAIEIVTTVIFFIDYALRIMTADLKLKKGKKSFALYPLTPMALIDLFSILPSLCALNGAFRLLKIIRLLRTLRVFRAFKVFRYSKGIIIIRNVFKRQKEALITVCVLAAGYIFISALILFNVEPDTFPNFFDAVYWATVSLTTVGYGDIYATSAIGKVITMISAFVGVGIVALPAGIITAGYMQEIEDMKKSRDNK